jgi:lysophospholipase L1-like esterase
MVRTWEPEAAQLALVILGVNDVVDRVPIARALAARQALADWLFESAEVSHVAFAALPPMDRFPALPQPLRAFAGSQARRHDRALATWAAGCTDVSHIPLELSLQASHMATDGFHPGPLGYRACGEALAARLHALVEETGT